MKLVTKPMIAMWREVSPHLALVVLCILTCVLTFLSEMAYAVSPAPEIPFIHCVPHEQSASPIEHPYVSDVLTGQ